MHPALRDHLDPLSAYRNNRVYLYARRVPMPVFLAGNRDASVFLPTLMGVARLA